MSATFSRLDFLNPAENGEYSARITVTYTVTCNDLASALALHLSRLRGRERLDVAARLIKHDAARLVREQFQRRGSLGDGWTYSWSDAAGISDEVEIEDVWDLAVRTAERLYPQAWGLLE